MKAKSIEQLEISRVWTVSTVHISGNDAKILGQITDQVVTDLIVTDLIVLEYREGFWLTVPDAEEFRVGRLTERLGEAGLTPAVGHILSVASSQSVEFVRIDADGPVYTFLPQFHW